MNTTTEKWKDIEGYEGFYQVSTLGNIKSLRRNIILVLGKVHGYNCVSLCLNGVQKTFRVHRLVAKAFIPNPEKKAYINHKDFDRTNNLVDNLEWVTPKENFIHAYRAGKITPPCPYAETGIHYNAVRVIQKNKNGETLSTYLSVTEAANKTATDKSKISACLHGRRKTANGFIWKRGEGK